MTFNESMSFILHVLTFKNVLDIVIVTTLIYFVLVFIKQTRSYFIFNAVIAIAGIVYIAGIFGLTLTHTLFQPFITFLFLIIIIVFQKEIRRFFEWFSLYGRRFAIQKNLSISESVTEQVLSAVSVLAKQKIGAIIVLAGSHPLEHSISNGTRLDGRVSSSLLLSIFNTKTPGHDGAVIIAENRIKHFGTHLPLAESFKNLDVNGTRHRAAAGITEITDAFAIVVSEERGTVSLARNGLLHSVTKEQFRDSVGKFIKQQAETSHFEFKKFWKDFIIYNWIEKAIAFAITILLWITISF